MKPLKITLALVLNLLVAHICFAQTTTKETINVWGNCGSCKKHIEKAAKAAGATTADWNENSKKLTVSYDASKTSSVTIQQFIAKAGYDTEGFTGDDAAYKKLDGCCQYPRKKTAAK